MIVDHETREVVRTAVFCGPPQGEFPKLLERLYTSLSGGHGAGKRTHRDSPEGAAHFSFAQIWLDKNSDYDSYLHVHGLNDVPDPNDLRWTQADAFILVHETSPQFRNLHNLFVRKFEKVRSANPNFVFDEWRTPADVADFRSDILSLLPAVHSGVLGPASDEDQFVPFPDPAEFESRMNADPRYWLEGELMKTLAARPAPREQMLYVEERVPRLQIRYALPENSLFDYIARTVHEPRSFLEIKKLGYRRLLHFARRNVIAKAQARLEDLIATHGEGSNDAQDLLNRLAKNQTAVSPSLAFSLVLCHQHLTGQYQLDDLAGRLRAAFFGGVDEMLTWFSEGKTSVKNTAEIPVLYEVLKDRIEASPATDERAGALHKLALLIHANPGSRGVTSF